MKISQMPLKSVLTGNELVPIIDPNEPSSANRNKKVAASTLRGLLGPQGPQGDSAYQIWLAAGNTGSITTFLASLKGHKGDAGVNGAAGMSAYQLWLNAGNNGDIATFLASLVGPQGPTGPSGVSQTPIRASNVHGTYAANGANRSVFFLDLDGDTQLLLPTNAGLTGAQKFTFRIKKNNHTLTFGTGVNLVGIQSQTPLESIYIDATYDPTASTLTGFYTYSN